MPRIAAATVAENRELRRDALLAAAATLVQRNGSFTVGEVAREVGLSRSAVYEYYSSAADLVADVIADEFAAWSEALSGSRAQGLSAGESIDAWLKGVLDFVIDGRHALLRAAGSIPLPDARHEQFDALHRALVAPLVEALATQGCVAPERTARYVWGAVEVAMTRIENGLADAADETAALLCFVRGGLSASTGG